MSSPAAALLSAVEGCANVRQFKMSESNVAQRKLSRARAGHAPAPAIVMSGSRSLRAALNCMHCAAEEASTATVQLLSKTAAVLSAARRASSRVRPQDDCDAQACPQPASERVCSVQRDQSTRVSRGQHTARAMHHALDRGLVLSGRRPRRIRQKSEPTCAAPSSAPTANVKSTAQRAREAVYKPARLDGSVSLQGSSGPLPGAAAQAGGKRRNGDVSRAALAGAHVDACARQGAQTASTRP